MKVSVVIPNYNGEKLLAKNLPKVLAAAGDAEVIVVDDASTDGSLKLLQETFPRVQVVVHKRNRRFAAACNSGVRAAAGEIVILLNSDVIPTKTFMKPLLKHFEDQETFSVGCREIEIKGEKKILSGRTAGEIRRGLLVHWRPKDQESQETLWTFGGSMAVDKEKYQAIGGMDELYSPAYWEDIDLCWQAKNRSWKVIFEKNAVVYHEHETTNLSVFGPTKMQVYAYCNQILFVWKNFRGRELVKHFLWLPYHLVFTTLKTYGLWLFGFFLAIHRWFSYPRMKHV